MVFNEEIILGGPLPLVIWSGAIAILGLVAFAAVLEAYLWSPMQLWMRLALLPGIVALFWPDLSVEMAGAALVVGLLAMNWWQSKNAKDGDALST
jgi:TRAP-type uncharacterized transport system fused permease subunit